MRPLKRKPQNRRAGARQFKRQVGQTKVANLKVTPMRGGWRL